jgi:hypothetical protein
MAETKKPGILVAGCGIRGLAASLSILKRGFAHRRAAP